MLEMTLPTAKTALAAALLVVAPFMAPSHARAEIVDARETASTVVKYADLNLSTPQGQATLKARIALAVTKVCGSTGGTVDLAQRLDVTKCRARATHDAYAAAKIGQPVLASR